MRDHLLQGGRHLEKLNTTELEGYLTEIILNLPSMFPVEYR